MSCTQPLASFFEVALAMEGPDRPDHAEGHLEEARERLGRARGERVASAVLEDGMSAAILLDHLEQARHLGDRELLQGTGLGVELTRGLHQNGAPIGETTSPAKLATVGSEKRDELVP